MVDPNLFPPKAPPGPPLANPRLVEQVNDTASRLAVMEERVSNLRRKAQLTEQSLLEYEKGTRTEVRALSETITDLSRKLEEVHEKVNAMAGELDTVARRSDVLVLERYLDLWQPMSFVTREEAKLLLREALDGKQKPQ